MRAKLPLALLLASTTVACVDDAKSAEPTSADVTSAIEKDNGGLDTTDEAPMFGAELAFDAASIEADAATADPMSGDPTIVAMTGPNATNVVARDLVILWGRMPADRTATTPRDWSGELRVSRGGMLVRRTVAFEDATDRVLPRTARDTISFQSRTLPASDGLYLEVLDPDPANTAPITL